MVQRKSRPAAEGRISPADTETIETYLLGDPETVEEVGGWILAELRRHYRRLAGEHDDLCQNVHQRVLVELRAGRFEGRANLRSYVSRIAHRTAIARLRQLYRDRALTESLSRRRQRAENPYRAIEARDKVRLAHRVVMALPEECRELWKLVFVEKLSYREVGRRLKIPPGTVKSRMWHCRRKATSALRRLRLLEQRL